MLSDDAELPDSSAVLVALAESAKEVSRMIEYQLIRPQTYKPTLMPRPIWTYLVKRDTKIARRIVLKRACYFIANTLYSVFVPNGNTVYWTPELGCEIYGRFLVRHRNTELSNWTVDYLIDHDGSPITFTFSTEGVKVVRTRSRNANDTA